MIYDASKLRIAKCQTNPPDKHKKKNHTQQNQVARPLRSGTFATVFENTCSFLLFHYNRGSSSTKRKEYIPQKQSWSLSGHKILHFYVLSWLTGGLGAPLLVLVVEASQNTLPGKATHQKEQDSYLIEVTKHKRSCSTQGTPDDRIYSLETALEQKSCQTESSNKSQHFHRVNMPTVQMSLSSFTARGHSQVQKQHFLTRACKHGILRVQLACRQLTSPTPQRAVYCSFLNLVHYGIFKCKRKINSVWAKVCLISHWCLKCVCVLSPPPPKKSLNCKQLLPNYDFHKNGNALSIEEVVC